ncbi:hypothetical protein [Cardiobacterium hominis]|jgi:ATP synthase epsilon chain (ATP synthase F1 sector epsilon subunit)|uniref:hypothetical protein n=1 Tax=Cardiobacterium hominis TaxID=2718 RepID=UPI00248F51BE|nr:hypothetical protein [Cardiobacterium hominis]
MKKSLVLTLMILGTPALADGNAVDRAQPQPPSKVTTTTTVITERTVNGQTSTETSQPVANVQEWQDTSKRGGRAAPAPADSGARASQLQDSFAALQAADTPEAMDAPLRSFKAAGERALSRKGLKAQRAQFREDIAALREAVNAGDLNGAKAQLDAIAQIPAIADRLQ